MKTLTSTLEAAQKKRHRLPCVEAEIKDLEQGIGRLAWDRIYTGSEADSHHGIAVDGQGSIHRIWVVGTTLYRQKQVTPFVTGFPYIFPFDLLDNSPDFGAWTVVTTDCNGPCAIAAYGARIYIFYRQNGVNRIRRYYSHNYGDTWTNAVHSTYTNVISMAAAWWAGSTGVNVICFTLRTNEISAIVWNTDTQTLVVQRIVTFVAPHTHIITNTYGIGATYNSHWSQCQVVFAGLRDADPYDHYNVFRCTLSATHYFSSLESFIMVPVDPLDTDLIRYEYPDCHFPPDSVGDYEETRITLVEKFTGVDPYKRPLSCHVVRDTAFSDTAYTEPRPFVDVSSDYGLRMATGTPYWWLSRPDGVWRARRTPRPTLDIGKDIVSLVLRTHAVASAELASGPGTLLIQLDNSRGQYSHPGVDDLASLRFRAQIELSLGYKTTAGAETVEAGTYWIDSWQYQSVSMRGEGRANLSTLTLYCLDGWSLANRWTPRYQLRWNTPAATPANVWTILYMVLARIGIRLHDGAWPRSSAILNFYPDFTLVPGQRGDTAIRRLLATVPDQLVFRGQDAFVKNPVSSESSCYDYGPAAHAIAAGKYADAVTASRTRAIGRDASDDQVIADAFDWDLQELYDQLVVAYDPNLATYAEALARAERVLRTLSLEAKKTQIIVPTNVGQELLDVVEVTDPRCGITAEAYRVKNIMTEYDRSNGRYGQVLTLGAP